MTKTAIRGAFTEASDDDLVDLARAGSDAAAFDELYRRYAPMARSVARQILRSRNDAEDVVNDAFAGVISAIGNGAGPRTNFKCYLMACVRNRCRQHWASNTISTDPEVFNRSAAVFEDPDRLSEKSLVASAFSSLSTEWQRTLWLTEVEDRSTSDVALELGRRPAAVAALAHRAREGFAEAYLSQHQRTTVAPACERISPKLAQYVRGRSCEVDSIKVGQHLETCVACTRAVDELRDLNSTLRSLALPTSSLGVGTAIAATAAPFAGAAAAGISGLSVAGISGIGLAKIAVLAGLLLVPVAAVAVNGADSAHRSIATADAAGSSAPAVSPGSTVTPSATPVDGGSPTVAEPGAIGSDALAPGQVDAIVPTGADAPTSGLIDAAIASVDAIATTVPGGSTVLTTGSGAGVLPGGSVAITGTGSNGEVGVAITLPGVSLPGVTAPGVTLPGVTVGGASVSGVSTPAISVPSLLPGVLPGVNVPSVSLPPTSVPPIVVPPISLPAIAVPAISLPPVTLPVVTVPPALQPIVSALPVTLPPVSLPPVVLPTVSLPTVTLPSIVVPPVVVTVPTLPPLPWPLH